jgi:hypothetical protein
MRMCAGVWYPVSPEPPAFHSVIAQTAYLDNICGGAFRRILILTMSIVAFQPLTWSQTENFPVPVASGTLGVRDAGALAEVRAHLIATAASGWNDLQAQGTVTLPNGDAHSASLYLLGSGFARLDVAMESGSRSLRISPSSAHLQDEQGNVTSLPPTVTAAGIVAFPRTWILGLRSADASLFDRGTFTRKGQQLHRITIEYCMLGDTSPANPLTFATDLYFDPLTHLLLFSVDALDFGYHSPGGFLSVSEYDDYKQFDGMLLPSKIRQELNGQPEWELQLTEISTNNNPTTQTFSF